MWSPGEGGMGLLDRGILTETTWLSDLSNLMIHVTSRYVMSELCHKDFPQNTLVRIHGSQSDFFKNPQYIPANYHSLR